MERIKGMRWKADWAISLTIGGWVALSFPTPAQIVPDNTLPAPSSVEAGCTLCTIEGGTRQDNNLFHSFTEFSVPTNGQAIFDHAIDIENIFSRVTGDAISAIDGLVETQGNTNLFLLNPNGILFGSDAQLNINGSLTASTANRLMFTNGRTFSATDPQSPPLLSVSTDLGLQEGTHQDASAPLINLGNLAVGQDLTLTASDLTIQGQLNAENHLKLVANNNIFVDGMLSTSADNADAGDISLQAGGNLTLFNGSSISANGLSGGNILVQSDGVMRATSSFIGRESTGNTPSTRRGGISLTADSVLLGETNIGASTTGVRESGFITIQADDTVVVDNSSLQLESTATGANGEINITTGKLDIVQGGSVASFVVGAGQPGDINVTATESVNIDGVNPLTQSSSSLINSTFVGVPRETGNISIATPQLALTNGASLATRSFGVGDSGDVVIQTDEAVLDGLTSPLEQARPTRIVTAAGQGDGGDIRITGRKLALKNGSLLIAATNTTGGTGNAGNVMLNLTDAVLIDGSGLFDAVAFNDPTRNAFIDSGVFVNTFPGSEGAGGNISIETRDLSLTNNAFLFASTATAEQSGNITIDSQVFSISERGRVSVSSTGEGEAGSITVSANAMSLDTGASLAAETDSSQGGNIRLDLQNVLLLRRGSEISTIAGMDQAGGNGGNITVLVEEGVVAAVAEENSDIVADAFEGRGGNITITAQSVLGIEPRDEPTEFSDIRASSELGIDGTIQVNTPDVDPDRGLVALPSGLLDSSQQLAQGCEQVGGETASQGAFYTSGRGGISSQFSEVLGSDDVIDDLRLPETEDLAVTEMPITEAQNWRENARGEVVLSAALGDESDQSRCWR